jgi:hypothetical protein
MSSFGRSRPIVKARKRPLPDGVFKSCRHAFLEYVMMAQALAETRFNEEVSFLTSLEPAGPGYWEPRGQNTGTAQDGLCEQQLSLTKERLQGTVETGVLAGNAQTDSLFGNTSEKIRDLSPEAAISLIRIGDAISRSARSTTTSHSRPAIPPMGTDTVGTSALDR